MSGLGLCAVLLIAVSSGSSFQLGKKKPPSKRGMHFYGVVALGIDQRPRNFAGMPSKLLFPIIWKMTLISIPPMWMAPTSAKPLQSFSNAAGG